MKDFLILFLVGWIVADVAKELYVLWSMQWWGFIITIAVILGVIYSFIKDD